MSNRKNKHKPDKRVVVFVYGTLRRGFPLNEWLDNSKYLGVDAIDGYSLLSLGAYPAMIRMAKVDGQPDRGYKVSGELWSVPRDRFEQLRRMEERVGYSTLLVETQGKTQAAAFVFGQVERATVEWAKITDGKEPTYDVRTIVVENDIPF